MQDLAILDVLKKDKMMRLLDDAKELAFIRSSHYSKSSGAFKVSQKQFREEMSQMFFMGALCSIERLWRVVDLDKELDTRDLVLGEFHIALLNINEILRKNHDVKIELKLEDLLYGKYSKANVKAELERANRI